MTFQKHQNGILYSYIHLCTYVWPPHNTFHLMPRYKCGIFRICFCFCFSFFFFCINFIFLYSCGIDTKRLQFVHFFHFSGMDFFLSCFIHFVRSFIRFVGMCHCLYLVIPFRFGCVRYERGNTLLPKQTV